jgi:hypothetical protein
LTLSIGRLFIGFSITAGYQQTLEDIAKKYNWKVQFRNEIISTTTPVMQFGVYELTKTHWNVIHFIIFYIINAL